MLWVHFRGMHIINYTILQLFNTTHITTHPKVPYYNYML